ncbi:hypothetical protein B0J18DRAFT_425285 [Chaetomium sp. MPI-SDFR-AT-0129]|nr:hypothetical protein B0J18DRAFT_425285 [Chaetomium sp. MPI-SDFR-AT-0129]
MGLSDLSPSAPKLALITLAIAPIVLPVGYLLYLDRLVSQNLTVTTGVIRTPTKRKTKSTDPTTTPTTPPRPITLPTELNLDIVDADTPDDDTTTWVLAYERLTSHPIPLSLLPPLPTSDSPPNTPALTTYLRTTMTSFRSTPQAYLLHTSVKHDAPAAVTFDRGFIAGLGFTLGDRVNGFWRVGYRGVGPRVATHTTLPTGDDDSKAGDGGVVGEWQGERVEMALDAPESYRGKRVEGIVVAGMEKVPLSLSRGKDRDGEEDGVVFVNETWMWRREGEAPVLLESGLGRWFHVVMSGWLVMRGVKAVVEE